jgi:hypothetical protein
MEPLLTTSLTSLIVWSFVDYGGLNETNITNKLVLKKTNKAIVYYGVKFRVII